MSKQGKQLEKEHQEQRNLEFSDLRTMPYALSERWWSGDTVAAVTGANRGIGYEIARQLAVHGLCVILTARDAEQGWLVVDVLRKEGLNVDFCQLDVCDRESVKSFGRWVVGKYGGLDILVNNAAVNFNTGSDNSVEFAEKVIATNYFGTKWMIETAIPIMRTSTSGARILNVSSRLGQVNGTLNRISDATIREQLLTDDCLSEELIDGMVVKFLAQVKDGTWTSNGWPQFLTDYSVSKLAVNAYTRFVARQLSDRPEGHKIYINCYTPGWVKTAMTGWKGNTTVEEGADTGVWVVLQPYQTVTAGKFFAERREIDF